jgi:hypothetical protein
LRLSGIGCLAYLLKHSLNRLLDLSFGRLRRQRLERLGKRLEGERIGCLANMFEQQVSRPKVVSTRIAISLRKMARKHKKLGWKKQTQPNLRATDV